MGIAISPKVLTIGPGATMVRRPDPGVRFSNNLKERSMNAFRSTLVAVCLVGLVGSGVALAQTTTPPPASTTSDDTSSWTSKKWQEMKAKYAKEKVKWADCRKQQKEQKLTGKASWAFLKDCMTK
jgi:hypothetical protein